MIWLNESQARRLMTLIAKYGEAEFNAATAGTLPPDEADTVRCNVVVAVRAIRDFLESHEVVNP